jgi:hypothetical protein
MLRCSDINSENIARWRVIRHMPASLVLSNLNYDGSTTAPFIHTSSWNRFPTRGKA